MQGFFNRLLNGFSKIFFFGISKNIIIFAVLVRQEVV